MPPLLANRFSWLLIVACSSGPSGGATPDPERPGGSSPTTSRNGGGTVASAGSPTAAECSALFEHSIKLGVSEQRASVPAEQLPTDAESAALKQRLETEVGASCRAGSRAAYECGLAATTLAQLAACR